MKHLSGKSTKLNDKEVSKPKRTNIIIICVFVVLCAIEGIEFIQSTGPMSIPDSDLHANTAYSIATGQAFSPAYKCVDPHGNQVKVQHTKGDARFLKREGVRNDLISWLVASFYHDGIDSARQGTHGVSPLMPLYDSYRVKQQASDHQPARTITVPLKGTMTGNRANQYFPIVYLPQAAGVWLGIRLGVSPFNAWQLGRASNLIVFLVLFGLAIAVLPRGKVFLTVLGMLPLTAFLASSLMSDAFYIAISALLIALVMKSAESKERMSNGGLALCITLTVLLFFAKYVYVVLALLVMVLPRRVLSTKRKAWFVGISMAIALPIYGIWSHTVGSIFPNVNVADNIAYALKRPGKVMVMIMLSILRTFPQNYPKKAISIAMLAVIVIAWVAYIVWNRKALVRDKSESWIASHRYFLVSIVIAILVYVLIYAIEAMIWNVLPTMKWTDYLIGVEERYVWPLLPLLLTIAYVDKPAKVSMDSNKDL
ncbi:DUF2142 domain-containing protein [Bifidobacterium sp. ESL0790]|uniref:DUF2142 domain-containing protein n=1 Tax=Bifidobacterium sp. ESL0790 TaxID=2983233 RepID=UPI0023F8991C|nr:DUF2142 domain-containing protein [Bifidobacterium sp. ESL0790]WEV72334.1 DUF2142 domain-containing protein [Bifidobacterium sp. ESL0790]